MNFRYELITDTHRWRDLWSRMPAPHILQSWDWGEIKYVTTSWRPLRYAFFAGEELLSVVTIGLRCLGPIRMMYSPRGPLLAAGLPGLENILTALTRIAKEQRALWLKIDPGIPLARKRVGDSEWQQAEEGHQLRTALLRNGWQRSPQQIQFANTQLIDLTQSEEAILTNMSANTRRKIRSAERKGVTIRAGNEKDLVTCFALYQETAARDGFRIRPASYYRTAWETMLRADQAKVFIAEFAGKAIAHSILLHGGRTCWFFYGASANLERQRMPNYALQWESICWAKRMGYQEYDFWGAPTKFEVADPLWGVYQFKRGFRGELIRGLGAWDYAPSPSLYSLYQRFLRMIR